MDQLDKWEKPWVRDFRGTNRSRPTLAERGLEYAGPIYVIQPNAVREKASFVPGSVSIQKPGIVKLDEPRHKRGHREIDLRPPLLEPFFEGKGLHPGEVEQRMMDDCCLPGVLAAMANTSMGKDQIRRMVSYYPSVEVRSKLFSEEFPPTKGLVEIRFTNEQIIQISRYLYRETDTNEVMYSRSNTGQGWVSFIEKAYAILLSNRKNQLAGYDSLIRIDSMTVMRDLIGVPKLINIKNTKDIGYLSKILSKAKDYPTVAATPIGNSHRFETTPHGAIKNHCYAILGFLKGEVILSQPDLLIPFEHFYKEFEFVITLQRS